MPARKPQINFQVDQPLKVLYDEAKAQGHWVTRFCAAGFFLMVEDPRARARAISRLREWEAAFADASPQQIRAFVEGAQAAMQPPAPGSSPGRRVRTTKRKTKRA